MRLVPLARLHFLHVYSNSPELFTDLQAVTCAVLESRPLQRADATEHRADLAVL